MKVKILGQLTALILTAASISSAAIPCQKPKTSEPRIQESDFHWNYSIAEMAEAAQTMYLSPKRLGSRAYFDQDRGSYVLEVTVPAAQGTEERAVPLSPLFLKSVTRHVEKALEIGYASHVFFPDLGHSHFFLPQKFFDERIDPLPISEFDELYRRIFAEPSVRVLYHTAEQLKMTERQNGELILPQDPSLLWRYFTRNLLGDAAGGENLEIRFAVGESYNTLRDLDGYRYWGAGFNISANEKGCFPFHHAGKTYYYDLSLKDIEP